MGVEEKKYLSNSALEKINKLYGAIFDENGEIRSEFRLTNDEMQQLNECPDDKKNGAIHKVEFLYNSVLYEKYDKNVQELCNLCYNSYLLERKHMMLTTPFLATNINVGFDGCNCTFDGRNIDSDGFNIKLSLKDKNNNSDYYIFINKKEKEITGKLELRIGKTETGGHFPSINYEKEISFDIKKINNEQANTVIEFAKSKIIARIQYLKNEITKLEEEHKTPKR